MVKNLINLLDDVIVIDRYTHKESHVGQLVARRQSRNNIICDVAIGNMIISVQERFIKKAPTSKETKWTKRDS